MKLTVLELCAGAGGQAIGLEAAGFETVGAVEIDSTACATLRANRPGWNVIEDDIRHVDGKDFRGVDLISGGVPCPPFSIAGRQLGEADERDLFPEALRLVEEVKPAAVMIENVPGLASNKFTAYRDGILERLRLMGYVAGWRVLDAASYGVPQKRSRFVLVAILPRRANYFRWPAPAAAVMTVGDALGDLMASRGWRGAADWQKRASGIAPTLVGGSKKHGGPDLGPTRAREQWKRLCVDGRGVADEPPGPEFPENKYPRLTVRMAARIQGFPDSWFIAGGKTASYKQVGNAFPPPVAKAVSEQIRFALKGTARRAGPKRVRRGTREQHVLRLGLLDSVAGGGS